MSDDEHRNENEKSTIAQQVEAINAQLRAFGREAVQEIKMMRDGQVIGQVRYGDLNRSMFLMLSTTCCCRRTGGMRS